MEIKDISGLYGRILRAVRSVMVGADEVSSLVLSALFAGGHVLLEDNPGTGKTTMARTVASAMGGTFRRVQFTPDLMPQDITGLSVYRQKEEAFQFVPGPVFANVLLADEINRATPRTQSALLQAMEEREVTADGETHSLPAPFLVIATENPVETAGTFPLPEAELDRFLIRVSMGDLSPDQEMEILKRFRENDPVREQQPVTTPAEMQEAVMAVRQVTVRQDVMQYIVDCAAATRRSAKILLGVSPRASLSLMRMSQAFAAVSGRDFVTPDDVRYLAPFVFGHRVILSGSSRDGAETVRDAVSRVAVPTEDFRKE